LRTTWPPETIKELLNKAVEVGLTQAVLESPREAELFRYAIYTYRKNHDEDGQWKQLSLTIEDCTVVVAKRIERPPVTILAAGTTA
jgi:hypothetical protein